MGIHAGMIKFVLDYKAKFRMLTLMFILLGFQVSVICAHSPHDVIDLVEISDTYELDKTIFMFERNRLYKSTDGGYSWKQIVKGLKNGYSVSAIGISPAYGLDGTVFLTSGGGGIYKSTNSGLSWALIKNELSNERIRLLAISPEYFQDNILLASDKQGTLYKTTNGGGNFYKVHVGAEIKAMAFASEVKPKFICIGDVEGGLYFSMDSGDT